MCGIGGFFSKRALGHEAGLARLRKINQKQRHRGPDGDYTWQDRAGVVGFAHTRLSILDIEHGVQPMMAENGNVITFNGEIYNFVELRERLGGKSRFQTESDTEVLLRAYERWGEHCVEHLRGMFAFTIWDKQREQLFVARDRVGIKPFYYFIEDGVFYFASEIKALLPFKKAPSVDRRSLKEYFTFQFHLGNRTLFEGISQLEPAHCGYLGRDLQLQLRRYWEVHYKIDWEHTEKYFVSHLKDLAHDAVRVHLRSDVEVGAYVSGGIDSSLMACLAQDHRQDAPEKMKIFHGSFDAGEAFDESAYAHHLAEVRGLQLESRFFQEQDFVDQIERVIYHLDQPVAGPGSFPQYMVSKLASEHVKVVLGGQGGDEVFGGYARYLIAYFEQCIKGALEGTSDSGKFVVTYESIIPNLVTLENYKPLIKEFWSEGLFDRRDQRYFRLINRSNTFGNTVNWNVFNGQDIQKDFETIFWGDNVERGAYFDSMTHFDFKTLLPALLHVEDRMSMAHGVESRVPILDHPLVEFAAQMPADVKFKGGQLKRLLRIAFEDVLPKKILERKDKLGFPVPLNQWAKQSGPCQEFILDTFRSKKAQERFYFEGRFDIEKALKQERAFGRNLWAFLSLELWQKQFLDGAGTTEGTFS